ncbi:MAG: GH116 family glycosyl-hydrolase [Candidatus Sumerlaeaceae bacterium]
MFFISTALALLCGAVSAAPAGEAGVEFVGQFNVQNANVRISGAPTEESAALLSGSRTGSDFHVILSALPSDALVEIELGFAELANAQPGQRVFDVDINEKRALSSFDIAATAGGPNQAVIRRFTITPKRGFLDFHFIGSAGEASINYIRVRGRGFTRIVSVPVDTTTPSMQEDPDALPTNLPSLNPETAEVLQDEMSPTWPTGFPLGGIGTGKFEILPNGEFANLTISNSWDLPVGRVPGTFFAIGAKSQSGSGTGKLLRVRPAGVGGSGNYLNAKTFLSCVFKGIFPVAQWVFRDDKMPLEVTLEGWSSLVPQDVGDSSLPAAVLYVHLRNPRSYPVSAGVAFSWEDVNGRGGSRNKGDQFGYAGSAVFSDAATSSIQGVLIRSTASAEGRRGTFIGDYFIGTPVKRAVVTRQLYWDPRSAEIPWWRSFTNRMRLEKVGPVPSSIAPAASGMRTANRGPGAAVICATVNLAPKERRRIPFIVAWYAPKLTTIASANVPATTEQQDYSTTFGSSLGVASYVATNRIRLQAGTSEWQSMVLRSNLPLWLKSHVLNSLSTIVSNSVLLQGRRYSTLESPGEMGGMMGPLDHRLASQPFLTTMYPSLDRSELELYGKAQSESGHLPRYIGNIHGGWTGLDARLLGQDWSDPTAAWVMQAAAHFHARGEREFADTIRPALDKAVAYLEKSDTSGDHLPDTGCFFDNSSPSGADAAYKSMNHSAALRAAAGIYHALEDFASEKRISSAALATNQAATRLLSGYGSASATSSTFAAALAGDWCLRSHGSGAATSDGVATGVLTSLFAKHAQENKPVLPMEVTADNPVTRGIASFPGLLQAYLGAEAILLGAVDLGIEMFARAQEVSTRVQHSPWRQALTATVPEGTKPRLRSHMSSPAAWTVLPALSGAFLDVPTKTLYLDPKVPSSLPDHEITIPVFTSAFWGWLDYNADTSTGTLAVTKVFPAFANFEIARVAQRQDVNGALISERRLQPSFTLRDGELLRFEGWPARADGQLRAETPGLAAVDDTDTTETLSEDAESTSGNVLTQDASTTDTVTSETKYGP